MPDQYEAFEVATKAVKYFGYMQSTEAKAALPAVIWNAIQGLGGWSKFCLAEDPRNFRQQKFCEAYKLAADRIVKARLRGSIDQPYLEGPMVEPVKRLANSMGVQDES